MQSFEESNTMDTIDEENEAINQVASGQGTVDLDGGIRRGDADDIEEIRADDPGPGGSASAGGIASNVEADGGGDGLERYRKKPRKKTSIIWEHIAEIDPGKNGKRRAQCQLCQKVFQMSKTSSTTTLKRHLEQCKSGHGIQTTLVVENDETSEGTTGKVSNFKYDHAKMRQIVSHMVLVSEVPFRFIESYMFNKMMSTATPFWKKISRAQVKADCISSYEIERENLKKLLKSVSKVNITTDLWSSDHQKIGYMVVTCHWIDYSTWNLKNSILNFFDIPPPHTGVAIADYLRKSFDFWDVHDKIGTISVDNARSNDSALRILKDDFRLRRRLCVDGKLFHVRCAAHILNLLVKDGLEPIQHIIDCIRLGVRYIVASEGRTIKFGEIVKQLQLPGRKLFLDCSTRWNSTYNMLSNAILFKEVYPRYRDRENGFEYVPSFEDWEKVEKVYAFLEVFDEVTHVFSGRMYPTANLFLPEVWRVKEVIDEKSRDKDDFVQEMASKMKEKFDKYWGESNLLMSVAAVLDPRYKLELPKYCFPIIFSSETEAKAKLDVVVKLLKELYEEYVNQYAGSQAGGGIIDYSTPSSHGTSSKSISSGKAKFRSFKKQSEVVRPKASELDVYLDDDTEDVDEESDESFDALNWWKANSHKYRILSRMAADILAIPMSTVASEAAFSAGGRVIDPYRASLKPETVEMLICGGDYIRELHGLKNKKEAKSGEKEFDLPIDEGPSVRQ